MTSELGTLPAVLSIYVVYGRRFDLGPVTSEVSAGIPAAAELIVRNEFGISDPGSPISTRP